MSACNHGETQISREGDRFDVPIDAARLSLLVSMIIEQNEDGDDSDVDNDINIKKIEIPLSSIKSSVLARIVTYLESYKQEPSEFAM